MNRKGIAIMRIVLDVTEAELIELECIAADLQSSVLAALTGEIEIPDSAALSQ